MWANFRFLGKYVKKQASAPGAFHAFHCHWTWPFFIQMFEILGTALGQSQFRGIPLKPAIGGPLLDHKIPTQTIRFAISKTKPPQGTEPANKWDADQCPSMQVFQDLFFDEEAAQTQRPRDISGGQDVLTWYSIEIDNDKAKRPDQKIFAGTVLVHGLYFAHNREVILNPALFTIGEETQKPKRPKGYKPAWARAPNSK